MNSSPSFAQVLARRFSCRAYREDPVPKEKIEEILTLAQRTASWCNAQPWQVEITSGAATERFRQAMLEPFSPSETERDFPWPSAYHGVYQERRRECGLALYKAVGVERGDTEGAEKQRRENFRLFGAPHVAIITTDEALGVYGAIDCGAYVSNFMLAASSLGVAAIAQAALATRPQRVRDFFGLPANRKVVCGISFGYADATHPANSFRTTRASTESAVTWVDH